MGLQEDVESGARQYRRVVSGASRPETFQTDQVRRLIPVGALAVAVAAAVGNPSSAADLILAAVAVAAFALWAYVPNVPLLALSLVVLIPVVVAQRSGQLEPLFFEACLLAFVVAGWSRSLLAAVALGLFAVASPVAVSLIQNPSEIAVGNWVMGIAIVWIFGRVVARQSRLAAELDAARRELAEQTLLAERRRIARDVHDFVGHGLAAVMLQVTSARHVLPRDRGAAEEALRSAEEVGRRSMHELRRTVTLLRSDDEARTAAPAPTASEIPALVDEARAGGLAVELRMRGDFSHVPPAIGVALYRITQEALANAARHAPRARTMLGLELVNGRVSLLAETTGPVVAGAASERERHYGLIGMRERAAALGGEFAAGPTRDGWLVRCELPVEDEGSR